MVDEPAAPRARSTPACATSTRALAVTSNPIPIKAALNLLGHRRRRPAAADGRAADEHEIATVRAMLEHHGLLHTACPA